MGKLRRAEPTDDLVTQLVMAEDEGDRLSGCGVPQLLPVADLRRQRDTRTAITHAGIAFAERCDQWQRVVDDPELMAPAIEEVLRWATPVLHMRRTASQDTGALRHRHRRGRQGRDVVRVGQP